MKKARMSRGLKTALLVVCLAIGALIALECAARFIYYQRHGDSALALARPRALLSGRGAGADPASGKGRWRPGADPKGRLSAEQRERLRQLRAIGYLSGSQKAPAASGVTVFDRERACAGLNLVVSGHAPEASLMDMDGREVHRWECGIDRAWPDFAASDFLGKSDRDKATFWRRAHVMADGGLLAIFEGIGLIRLDKESKLIWARLNGAHHDLYVAPDGTIFVLTRTAHINRGYNPDSPILEDFICRLDPRGRELGRISILDCLANSTYAPVLKRARAAGDIFHTNTIERIEEAPRGKDHPLRQGTFLVSVRKLDFICAIDIEQGSVYWGETGFWHQQHQPTLLANGNLLVFDNSGRSGESSVLEYEFASRKIVWAYRGNKIKPFYSESCGSCQRLANGNTLITETDRGRAFEVAEDGRIVWEYVNPRRAGEKREWIASLFDVVRLDRDFPLDWLPE